MANIQMLLNESQKVELQKIVKKINSSGGYITASILENTLRASSPFKKDIKLLKDEILKIR
ncbi:hypothetical protein [Sphingobacterium multivorum]|uniref:hypothetical protein n=1 Tax=Sphingobacterium multivorum TaxID=28454 RepID=UPI00301A3E15